MMNKNVESFPTQTSYLIQNLKKRFSLRGNLIFSYHIEPCDTVFNNSFTIQQKETGISLAMKIEKSLDKLAVKSFMIVNNTQLEAQSLSLYDAAIIEITLHGLELVFSLARQNKILEVIFLLPRQEGETLTTFESFFHSLSYQGNQLSLTLPTDKAAYDIYVKHTEIVKARVQSALWVAQREDALVRGFLQSSKSGGNSPLTICPQETLPPLKGGTIIAFPTRTTGNASDQAI